MVAMTRSYTIGWSFAVLHPIGSRTCAFGSIEPSRLVHTYAELVVCSQIAVHWHSDKKSKLKTSQSGDGDGSDKDT